MPGRQRLVTNRGSGLARPLSTAVMPETSRVRKHTSQIRPLLSLGTHKTIDCGDKELGHV